MESFCQQSGEPVAVEINEHVNLCLQMNNTIQWEEYPAVETKVLLNCEKGEKITHVNPVKKKIKNTFFFLWEQKKEEY